MSESSLNFSAASSAFSQQALNKAMMEAVEFVHAEGWGANPTLFALAPTSMLVDQLAELPGLDDDAGSAPLTLVVQDHLPEHIDPGSEELADYCARLAWPQEVAGVVLAQEIMFRDVSAATDGGTDAGSTGASEPRQARLFSGVLRDDEIELTLLQIRPSDEEIAEAGPFTEDEISLRGGPNVAPGVIAALRYGLEQDPEEML